MDPSANLGPRLETLLSLVQQRQNQDDCVWDCCCDHGHLGIKILHHELCNKLVFVDQVPHIIAQLEAKIAPFSTGKHQLIVADASELNFSSQQQHLVIIAGVGGEQTIKIIHDIAQNNPDSRIDYLLCPSNRAYQLREYLITQNYGLDFETIVSEKSRSYEVIALCGSGSKTQQRPVSAVGAMWDLGNPEHRRYLNQLISHLKKKSRGEHQSETQQALQGYQMLLDKFG